MATTVKPKAWRIAACATCLGMCNLIFTWSVIKKEIRNHIDEGDPAWDWDRSLLNFPYSFATVTWALAAVPAGQLYDRYGPRVVASGAAMLQLVGLAVCSLSTSMFAWVFGFGICMSSSLGTGFIVATSTAVKWFPSSMTGLIAGIVTSGFGLSPAYLSMMLARLVDRVGLLLAMRCFAVGCAVFTFSAAQGLENPETHSLSPQPRRSVSSFSPGPSMAKIIPVEVNFTFGEAMRTRTLWLSWLLYALGGGAGTMVIAEANTMAVQALGPNAPMALAVLSVGNCTGRLVAGVVNDYVGLRATLLFFFAFHALMMWALLLIPPDSVPWVLVVAGLLGVNYGANPCLWGIATKFFFGTRYYGSIFSVVMTGWGLGSFVFSNLSQGLQEATGSINATVTVAVVMLVVSLVLILFLDTPVRGEREASLELGGSRG